MKKLLLIFFVIVSAVPIYSQGAARSVVGSWKLIKYVDTAANGKTTYPWGEKPSGVLIYDETGHMAVQIQRTPVLKLAATAETKLTRSQKAEMLNAYTAYFGRYIVDWEKMTITHLVDGNLFSFYNGTAQPKTFEVEKDRFVLKVSWQENGQTMNGVRIFERMKAE